ncbi:MAG TPA: hypothetical protein DD491_06955 [Halieaceae bacterium]|nr:hypothetical protein [Halieaceae bacterium]
MADITTGLIEALEFLLPGFLTAWIFYGFTPYDRPSHFERIIQALLFTAIIQGLIAPLKAKGWWPASYEVPLSLLLAVILGVVAVGIANRNPLHRLMSRVGLSGETSFASEWYRAFNERKNSFVMVELRDGRRMGGWVREWPSRPAVGHLGLQTVSWVDETGAPEEIPGVEEVLLPVEDIGIVYFLTEKTLDPQGSGNGGEQNGV